MTKLNKYHWLNNLFLFLFLFCLPLNAQSPDSLNFLVISDFGGQGGKIQKDVAYQLGQIARLEKSKFIITAGDNYHLNGISSANDPRWKSEYEDIYTAPSLRIPWYASLGNHDYLGSPEAEINYSKISRRWKMPSRYYAHSERINDSTEILFVHIDTSPFITEYKKSDSTYHVLGQDINIQLRWIDSVLASSRASWKIVVGHHPIYSSVGNHGNNKELIDSILPLLLKYNVKIYLCGHEHFSQYLVHGPVNFFVCGGGSVSRPVSDRNDVKFGIGSPGFLSMTVTPESAIAVYYDDKGNNLYSTTIKVSSK
jgi:tartrate-resistant acid phosphatase type 5